MLSCTDRRPEVDGYQEGTAARSATATKNLFGPLQSSVRNLSFLQLSFGCWMPGDDDEGQRGKADCAGCRAAVD